MFNLQPEKANIMRLLLLSNSTNVGEEYLAYSLPFIDDFVKEKNKKALFIPYAGVSISWDNYYSKVKEKLALIGIHTESIHLKSDPITAIEDAGLIIVGGGNTFHLLKTLQELNLIPYIQKKVFSDTPYIGWSAGSNLTCPSIRTTNDMPIVEPHDFNALNLIPFQINPHFTEDKMDNHGGESREDRIKEFLIANPDMYVAGLREGTMFKITDESVELLGDKSCKIFKYDQEPLELESYNDFNFLVTQ